MDRTPILDIKIEANGPAVHMQGENAEVLMVPFKGSVDCDIFRGIVEPCGVDTQIVNAAGVRHMSARYLMTGTVPTFYTDSRALAPYLHRNQFVGEGHDMEDGLHILFFEIGEDKRTDGGTQNTGQARGDAAVQSDVEERHEAVQSGGVTRTGGEAKA